MKREETQQFNAGPYVSYIWSIADDWLRDVYVPDAWVDEDATKVGYEISFTKYFYKPAKLRELADIAADLKAVEAEAKGLLGEVLG